MNLVRILHCPNYESINQEIADWVEKQQISGNCFWNPVSVKDLIAHCPKFKCWLLENKVLISTVAVTYGKQPDCCTAHIDTKPARFKLSWPVKNVIGTWNRWFRAKDSANARLNALGGTAYDYEDLEEIYRHKLTGPCLIDAGTIHDVWCDADAVFPRIGLQCQLIQEPESL